MRLFRVLFVVALAIVGVTAHAEADSPLKGLLVRGRAIAVIPQSDASISSIGGDTQLTNAYVPELDFTWFFNKNIAVEAIAAVSPHDVKAIVPSILAACGCFRRPCWCNTTTR